MKGIEVFADGMGCRRWLVTGAAGFIGSHLVEALLRLDQNVTGLDNFSCGHARNLREIEASVTPSQWERFHFIQGDICRPETCQEACGKADFVLHQAALGSVPRSIEDPEASHRNNVTGFVHLLCAARACGVRRFVYASSGAVYGNSLALSNVEDSLGISLSPYAVTKRMNELYADIFSRCYDIKCIGLRYFNVFGPRQNTLGAYVNVIPKWAAAMMRNEPVFVNGDGETSRDFCYIGNVVQANIRAALTDNAQALNEVYNVATGVPTTLNQLYPMLKHRLLPHYPDLASSRIQFRDFRAGDPRFSRADISKARHLLGYEPSYDIEQGLDETLAWFMENLTAVYTAE